MKRKIITPSPVFPRMTGNTEIGKEGRKVNENDTASERKASDRTIIFDSMEQEQTVKESIPKNKRISGLFSQNNIRNGIIMGVIIGEPISKKRYKR